ncbi:DUF2062 domain-containing protein [Roseateles amylovorans]|uniref:DUF2062 domain-containing protein n=1 Tax=Roseateles amylovorans TaxID=2978473 RepID=A0ABY6AWA0_9BURK|nr:DUF2062 domain-containing protein [Roseateles amylovorans]UXH77213.1 DUF2062 domain-containing protein [Roseateles amylovorans]
MTATRIAKRLLPSPESLSQTPGLRWLGAYLRERPWLWVAHRRRVALGAALGLAVGVIPLPTQMLMAAVVAIACRANVAAAIAATWLTNPLTLVPIWGLAIFLGRQVLGVHGPISAPSELALDWGEPGSWWPAVSQWLSQLGAPLLVGLPLAGAVLGTALYIVVYLGWWAVIRMERRRRLRERELRV